MHTLTLQTRFIQAIQKSRTISLPLSWLLGVALLAVLTRVAIPLPGTPVPVTGQTFGVALLSLLWGRKRGFGSVAAYLVLGSLGLPFFAKAASLWVAGPTTGYLVGMLLGSWVMSRLSDRGFVRGFWTALAATAAGSFCVFTLGVSGLVAFVPAGQAVVMGWIPFIPGDVLKSVLAAAIVARTLRQVPQA